MRCHVAKLTQLLAFAFVFMSMLLLLSNNGGAFNKATDNHVIHGITRLITLKNETGQRKWDPFGLFKGEETGESHKENVIFTSDKNLYKETKILNCSKQLDFIFVKVHKAGSTTLISILQRFSYRHNLKVALPKNGDIFLGWPFVMDPAKHVLPLRNGEMKFNVLVNHAVFNKQVMSKIIPNQPKFIGIVRNPLTHFKSAMNYFQKMLIPKNEEGKYTMMERIIRFADNPNYYDGVNDRMKDSKDPKFHVHSVTRNLQSADLGLKYQDMTNLTQVEKFFSQVKQDFPFMLIMEHMHESLLLLKRRWCWDLMDILFLQKNVFKYQGKSEVIPPQTAYKLLTNWLDVDVKLYKWANETLWNEIDKEEDFHMELSYYKSINNLVGSYCKTSIGFTRAQGPNPKSKMPPLEIAASYWNEPMTIPYDECKNLMRFEMAFTRLLQIKQRPDLFDEKYYREIRDGISVQRLQMSRPSPKVKPKPKPAEKPPSATTTTESSDSNADDESDEKETVEVGRNSNQK